MRPRGEISTGPRARDVYEQERAWPLGRVFDRWEKGRPLVREPRPCLFVKTEVRELLDPEAWGAGYLRVVEGENRADVYAALIERAPQAILRDLHRPVEQYLKAFVPDPETAPVQQMREAWRAPRAAMVLEGRPPVMSLLGDVRAEQERRRRLLTERWKPFLPDDAPRQNVVSGFAVDGEEL